MWDFGTVRHVGRPATIGRNNNIQVSGPPLTWENNGAPVRQGSDDSTATARRTPTSSSSSSSSSGSASRYGSSITLKGDLPPLPPSPAGSRGQFDQSTVRREARASTGSQGSKLSQSHVLRREPSDEYDDDFDDQYTEAYPDPNDVVEGKLSNLQIEEEILPDTTMLDSVILPAIASVCSSRGPAMLLDLISIF